MASPARRMFGLTSDGINRLYVAINGQGIWRYIISSKAMQLVATGGTDPNSVFLPFAFVGGHSNLLQLDRLGNVWIGDDTSDGMFNFSGPHLLYLRGSARQYSVAFGR